MEPISFPSTQQNEKKRYGLHRYYVLGPSQVEIVEKSTCKKRCLDGLFQCPTNLNIYLRSTSDSLSEDDDLEEESDEPESESDEDEESASHSSSFHNQYRVF